MLENNACNEEKMNPFLKEFNYDVMPERRKKVMVIDDDQDFRLSLSELLVEEGFSVTTAKDGEVALNKLIHHAELPDLILVDVMMPVMSGLQFRREQLLLNIINQIPVVFMTGHGYIEGESVLLKPLDQSEFLEAIRGKMV